MRTATAVIASTLLLSGCGMVGGSPQQPAPTVSEPAGAPSAGASSAGGGQPAATPSVSGTIPPLGDPIGSRNIKVGGNSYDLDLYPLRRGEGVVILNARVRYTSVTGSPSKELLSASGAFNEVTGETNGFTLVDAANKKLYRPAKGQSDRSLCAPQMPSSAKTGDELYVSCVFGAPPPGVTTVAVGASRFGSFDNVPLG